MVEWSGVTEVECSGATVVEWGGATLVEWGGATVVAAPHPEKAKSSTALGAFESVRLPRHTVLRA